MEKHYSLLVAEEVLNLIQVDRRSWSLKATIRTFQNGREQGYSIQYFNKDMQNMGISWAQHRSSDDIVVYHGFNVSGQVLSNDAYDNSMIFKELMIQEAADYILETILDNCHETEIKEEDTGS